MPDVLMKPGWASTLQLKTGATQLNIPVLRGEYRKNDGRIVEMLAQGNAQNAYPINSTKAPDSSVLTVTARAFSNWFSAANLESLFVTRDANGDLAACNWKVSNGIDSAVDGGKGTMLRIAGAAAQGPLSIDMGFLGTTATNATTFTAYAAQAGSPFYQNCVSFKWTPTSGVEADLTLVEEFALTLMTGATPGKWFDCQDGMSNIDQGIQSGSLVLSQRAGATTRMDAATSGTLKITMAPAGGGTSVMATLQLVRLDVGRPLDPLAPGGAKIPSSWALLSATGSNPVVFTNPAA